MAIKTFVGTKYSRFETYSTKKHDRHTLHHDIPPIVKDNITGQHLTPNLSSRLAPFQSNLCTANDLIAVTFFRKKESQLLLATLDHSGPHRLIGHLHSQKLLQTVDNTPTALLRIKRRLPRTIVIVEDIINHTRTLPPLLRVQHFVRQLSLVFLWFVNKNHQCLPPRFLRRPIFMGATTKGITDQVHLPVNDVSYFSKHALRHVGDWLQRVRGAVDAEGFEIVEHVCLGTHRDKACVGRHGRKRPDDDQAVSAVEFPVENVETGVTRVAVSEESVDTVLGDSQLRPPLVELRGSNEFPESLGDEGESWVMATWYAS
ncbi:unnamed protein product [Brassica napus]|nr:unnamed protein product [Brassica napus]